MKQSRCRFSRLKLEAWHDNELPPDQAEAVRRHLQTCRACQEYVAELAQASAQLSSLPAVQLPPDFTERVISRMPERAPRRDSPTPVPLLVPVAMAILLGFGLGLYFGRTLWPRQVTEIQIVKVPQVREKIVEVEVPVVRERVVVKRVPIYRTRVVYREREAPEASPDVEPKPEPVKLDEVIIHLASKPLPPPAQIREELFPARLAEEAEAGESAPAGESPEQSSAVPEETVQVAIAVSQGLPTS